MSKDRDLADHVYGGDDHEIEAVEHWLDSLDPNDRPFAFSTSSPLRRRPGIWSTPWPRRSPTACPPAPGLLYEANGDDYRRYIVDFDGERWTLDLFFDFDCDFDYATKQQTAPQPAASLKRAKRMAQEWEAELHYRGGAATSDGGPFVGSLRRHDDSAQLMSRSSHAIDVNDCHCRLGDGTCGDAGRPAHHRVLHQQA